MEEIHRRDAEGTEEKICNPCPCIDRCRHDSRSGGRVCAWIDNRCYLFITWCIQATG